LLKRKRQGRRFSRGPRAKQLRPARDGEEFDLS
jgi:hypothetical protein